MKKKVLLVTLLVVAIVASCFAFTACNKKGDDKGDGSKMKVAMITDYGDITDQSFNQTTYEASKAFCEANGLNSNTISPQAIAPQIASRLLNKQFRKASTSS